MASSSSYSSSKVWYQEAFEDGEESGQTRGESLKLIDQICRKLKKGKTAESIAEELEESLETVEQICEAVVNCDPDASTLDIYNQLQNTN